MEFEMFTMFQDNNFIRKNTRFIIKNIIKKIFLFLIRKS